MINISIPYKAGSPEQIPLDYIILNNFKIEANVFDITQLSSSESLKKLKEEILNLQSLSKGVVRSLHFPTENADYFYDSNIFKILHDTIDFCSETEISIVVLHSNIIDKLNIFNKNKVSYNRLKYISLIKELDLYITEKNINVKVCIENMPIIGNLGDDFDSIFIFPEDFSLIKGLKNISMTLDICHWGFTCEFLKNINNIHEYIIVKKNIEFNDMLKNKDLIDHIHLGSFEYLTFPFTNVNCNEGIIPEKGLLNSQEIIFFLNNLQSDDVDRVITLEIKEDDYTNRINLKKTVDWFKVVFSNLLP
jgi:hypothetical protein